MSNIVKISQAVTAAKKAGSAVKRTFAENENGENVVDEVLELSAYLPVRIANEQQQEAYHASIVNECARLMAAFPMKSDTKQQSFYSILYGAIEDNKMSVQRVRDAINKLIYEHTYSFFTPADILSYDKVIVLTTTIDALKRKVKYITNENIVVVHGAVNGIERRMYGIKDEVENSPYANRIIGVWKESQRGFEWIGSFDDPTIPARQRAFKESLFKYCDTPKNGGAYSVDVVKAFYDHYSQVVKPGDTLLFECYMNFDTEIFLESFNQRYNQSKNQQL